MREAELRKIYLENRRQAQIRIPDWAEAENLEQVMAQNSIWKIRSDSKKRTFWERLASSSLRGLDQEPTLGKKEPTLASMGTVPKATQSPKRQ